MEPTAIEPKATERIQARPRPHDGGRLASMVALGACGVLALSAVATRAQAQTQVPAQTLTQGPAQAEARTSAAAPPQAPATVAATVEPSSQVVVRDAATGLLRAPTAAEAAALQAPDAHSTLRRAAAPAVARSHPSGARGARLSNEFMSYSVVVRQADGRMAEACVTSPEQADALVRSAPQVPATGPVSE